MNKAFIEYTIDKQKQRQTFPPSPSDTSLFFGSMADTLSLINLTFFGMSWLVGWAESSALETKPPPTRVHSG